MNPRVDIVISDDIVLGRAELNSYCKITRILYGKLQGQLDL